MLPNLRIVVSSKMSKPRGPLGADNRADLAIIILIVIIGVVLNIPQLD